MHFRTEKDFPYLQRNSIDSIVRSLSFFCWNDSYQSLSINLALDYADYLSSLKARAQLELAIMKMIHWEFTKHHFSVSRTDQGVFYSHIAPSIYDQNKSLFRQNISFMVNEFQINFESRLPKKSKYCSTLVHWVSNQSSFIIPWIFTLKFLSESWPKPWQKCRLKFTHKIGKLVCFV